LVEDEKYVYTLQSELIAGQSVNNTFKINKENYENTEEIAPFIMQNMEKK
jgi:hypothetical protein